MSGAVPAGFSSLSAFQAEHLELLNAFDELEGSLTGEGEKDAKAMRGAVLALLRRVRRFAKRAAATGVSLDARADRALAQTLIDGTGSLETRLLVDADELREATGRARRGQPRLPAPRRLARFDEAAAPVLDDARPPFVGLNAFGERDAAFFHGRQAAVDTLIERVGAQRLAVITGPSGSGKSSLVMAGLVPLLKQGALPGSKGWTYLPPMQPGADPLAALLQVVKPAGADPAEWRSQHEAALQATPAILARLVGGGDAKAAPLLLIVDQAEELFTMCVDPPARLRFGEALQALVSTTEPAHHVLMIVRADFVARLHELGAAVGEAAAAMVRFDPEPLSEAELRRAIEMPAAQVGLRFEEGIVDDLVRAVLNDPAALPLLQFTLTELWRERKGKRNRIDWETYKRVGRPAEAVARKAQEVYQQLGSEQNQRAARQIFRALVLPAGGAELVRQRVRRETLHKLRDPTQIDRSLKPFVDAGLIRKVSGGEPADDRFEVMHEALLRNWPDLAKWLNEHEDNRAAGARQLEVLERARLWDRSARDPSYLATGEQLAVAESFADNDPVIAGFVAASRERMARARRQRSYLVAGIVSAALFLLAAVTVAVLSNLRASAAELEIAQQLSKAREKQSTLRVKVNEQIEMAVQLRTAAERRRLVELLSSTRRANVEATRAADTALAARRSAAVRTAELGRATRAASAASAELRDYQAQLDALKERLREAQESATVAQASATAAEASAMAAQTEVATITAAAVQEAKEGAAVVSGNTLTDIPTLWQAQLAPNVARIATLAQSVGRLDNRAANGRWAPSGTAFMVAPDIAVVFNFVLAQPGGRYVGSAIDFRDRPDNDETRKFRILGTVAQSPFSSTSGLPGTRSDLRTPISFTLVRLERTNAAGDRLPPPLAVDLSAKPTLGLDYALYVVSYPNPDARWKELDGRLFESAGAGIKRVSPGYATRTVVIPDVGEQIYHTALTSGGSAGAPVIDLRSNRVIGMQFARRATEGVAVLLDQRSVGKLMGGALPRRR